MSQDSIGLSRRQILAAVGAIGTAGTVAGVGTGAYLSDRQRVTNALETGSIAIDVDCDACSIVDGRLAFAFDGLDRGDGDTITVSLTVETNPARLWLRTRCPPISDALGEALAVVFRVDGDTIAAGSLSAVSRTLATGVRLASCTDPETAIDLELEWELPDDVPDSVAGETTEFTVELVAEQCRHVDADSASDPFASVAPCEEPPDCVACPEQNGNRIAQATFAYDGPDGETTLELLRRSDTIEFERTVEPGETFTAVLHEPPEIKGSPDFDVVVDGTTIGDFHISCSQPFGPGLVIADGTYSLTVLEAVDTDGNPLCEVDI
ncbi:hypothetical protein [Natronorubrum thiooxidans]|uniref:SipW-cognate class signal peptide n=1 Tax=Natronorubrum thiooxidans TaxID=308853 RepID=A0A1N7GZ39_9EURY|nr:hypothetical protein [Natronorubrum thiooxidans]SIS17796.1 hypothetical protein SAMN05421752_11831 [Natronorubrum thiooxidans]